MIKKYSLVNFLLAFTIIFCLWGFVLQQTVYGNTFLVYVSFITILLTSIMCLLYNKNCLESINVYILVWLPYLLYTVINLMFQGDIERVSYWVVCTVIVLISQCVNISRCIPFKIFYYSGLICLIGIWIQILFPELYNTYIVELFINSQVIKNWAQWHYGYAGFTCQLGMTSVILVYFVAYILYVIQADKHKENSKLIAKLFLIIAIISIFLTGKRMMSLITLTAPLIVYVLSEKNTNKKMRNILLVTIILFFIIGIFYYNIEWFSNSNVLGRIAKSIIGLQKGDDITSNRKEIVILAKKVFKDNPVLGVGVSRFKVASGAYTDVHNSYMQILCEQGILGFVAFIIPMIMSYFKTISLINTNMHCIDNKLLRLSLFIQTMFILYSFTGNTIVDRHCYIIYFISIGIMIDNIKKESNCNEKNWNSYFS